MRSAARRRREAGLPVGRPVSAERIAVFDTVGESMARYAQLPHGPARYGAAGGWRPELGLVFAVEEFAHAGLVKHGSESIGNDFGD